MLIALVLFSIVRIFNRIRENNGLLSEKIKKKTLNRAERKELKSAGVSIRDRKAVKAYFEKKEADALLAEEQAKKDAEEQARLDRLANPTTEDLLKQIKEILEKSVSK